MSPSSSQGKHSLCNSWLENMPVWPVNALNQAKKPQMSPSYRTTQIGLFLSWAHMGLSECFQNVLHQFDVPANSTETPRDTFCSSPSRESKQSIFPGLCYKKRSWQWLMKIFLATQQDMIFPLTVPQGSEGPFKICYSFRDKCPRSEMLPFCVAEGQAENSSEVKLLEWTYCIISTHARFFLISQFHRVQRSSGSLILRSRIRGHLHFKVPF